MSDEEDPIGNAGGFDNNDGTFGEDNENMMGADEGDRQNDDFDDGWSYPNSYEESSDDEKDPFY